MSEARREAVLRATSELLDEIGVAALTIRQVAERAGVAQGSVFLYAENKADLVNQVYGSRIATRWHQLMTELSTEAPLDRVEKFYLGCVEIFYEDLDNVQAFYAAISSDAGHPLPSVDRINERVGEAILDAEQSGALRAGVDLEALIFSYQGLYSNVLRLARAGASLDRARRITRESLKQLRNGITA